MIETIPLAALTRRFYVYYLICDAGQGSLMIKIGKSVDPASRLQQLHSGCPFRFETIGMVACTRDERAYKLEAHLHRTFADRRINGEWFKFTQSEPDKAEFQRGLRAGALKWAPGQEWFTASAELLMKTAHEKANKKAQKKRADQEAEAARHRKRYLENRPQDMIERAQVLAHLRYLRDQPEDDYRVTVLKSAMEFQAEHEERQRNKEAAGST